MKIRFFLTIAMAALLGLPCSCSDTEAAKVEDRVTLLEGSTTSLSYPKDGGTVSVKFVASNSWSFDMTGADWITPSKTSGATGTTTVKFVAEANVTPEDRSAEFTLKCGEISMKFTASQPAKNHLYKVVAHRGGYLENGCAENSISALKSTIDTRCYAAECDIMWTSDNDVLICHPDDLYMVNGLYPFSHTLAEIRAAGTLGDGTQMPCLGDFLAILADKEQNPLGTKLWLDVKGSSTDWQEKVMYRAAEIAKSMDACQFVEFLVPGGYSKYVDMRGYMMTNYGIDCAWNGVVNDPSVYGSNGWGQMPFGTYNSGNQYWPPTTYTDKGVRVSIYQTPSSLSSYTQFYRDVIPYYETVKALFVNHPKALIQKLIEAGYETE